MRGRARFASGSRSVARTLAGTGFSAVLASSIAAVAASIRRCAPGRAAFFCFGVPSPFRSWGSARSAVASSACAVASVLRARWRIENMFKYASGHNGIDALADYAMDIGPDTRMVKNPARLAARKTLATAQAELATAERALPQLLNGEGTPKQKNAALPGAHRRIEAATAAIEDAKTALKPVPAKILATDLDPDAKRARPRIQRRGLQMVQRR